MAFAAMTMRKKSALVFFGCCGCATSCLGTWQAVRVQQKSSMLAEREKALDGSGSTIDDCDTTMPCEYSRVQCTGRFLHDGEMLLGPRSKDGKHGYIVVTPFVTTNG